MEQTQIPFGMLLQKAVKIRTHILEMLAEAKSGHPGGSLSAVEILVSLYFYKMRHDPKRPNWPDRDRFVLSKGHAAPVLFATLAEAGYIPVSELKTLRKLNSRLQGHPDYRVPGVEFPGGSLGIGLSAAIGMALAGKIDKTDYRVYALLGDGELDEGENMRNRPTVIIAHTVKGKGVSFMEWDPAYHGKAPDKDTVKKLVESMRQQ